MPVSSTERKKRKEREMQNATASIDPNDIDTYVIHGYADNHGVKIHYASLGEGPLVVMIHAKAQRRRERAMALLTRRRWLKEAYFCAFPTFLLQPRCASRGQNDSSGHLVTSAKTLHKSLYTEQKAF
jgi:hypothetical protein